jgi:colanic acid biosynthesis glycosyl transferase WcaI
LRLFIYGINYAPELVGIGRYSGEMGEWLASRGHSITVMSAPPYYPEWRIAHAFRHQKWHQEWLNGVEVLRAPLYVPAQVTGTQRILQEISFLSSCFYWWPYIFSRSWDAVVAICPPLLSGVMPSLLSKWQRIPFIFHFQDLQVDAARQLNLLRLPGLFGLLKRLEHILLSRAAVISTISAGMAMRLSEKGVPASRLHLFPNWADLDNIKPSPGDNSIRKELGGPQDILVIYAGNLGEKQGLGVILESAALTRERLDIRYLLAGDGAAKPQLLKQAQDLGLSNVSFLPLQSKERFPLFLAAGEVHLVVQRKEAGDLVMPSKLANIMAAGRPFIATALPDTELARVTLASQGGILIPPEDSQALAQAILLLAGDEKSREEMGLKGRSYVEAHLNKEDILSRFEEMLYHITHSSRS